MFLALIGMFESNSSLFVLETFCCIGVDCGAQKVLRATLSRGCFLVLCKLSDYHKNTGNHVRLHRQSEFVEFDDPISKLCSLFPYVEYVIPSTYFDSKSGLNSPFAINGVVANGLGNNCWSILYLLFFL